MIDIIKKLFFVFLLLPTFAISQEKFTLSGNISEQVSNEKLIGVNIIIPEFGTGTITNEYGFYSITLPQGTYNIQISYLGFSTLEQTVLLNENKTINFQLLESTENLDEIVIETDVEKLNIKNPQMSVNALAIKTIKQMPYCRVGY